MNEVPIGPEQPDRPILANGDSQPEPTLNLNPWCRCGLGQDREGLTHCLYRAMDGGYFCLECHHAGVSESPMPCSCDCEFCDPDGDSDMDLSANQSQEPNADLQQGTGLAQFFPLEVTVEPPPATDIISVSSSTMSEGHSDEGLIASLCPMSVDDITVEDPPTADGNQESSRQPTPPRPMCQCDPFGTGTGCWLVALRSYGYVNSDYCHSCAGSDSQGNYTVQQCTCECPHCDPSGARRVDNPEIIGDVDSGVTSETRVPVEGQDDLGTFDDEPSGSENT